MFNNLSLRIKLSAAFGIIILLLVTSSTMFLTSMQRLKASMADIEVATALQTQINTLSQICSEANERANTVILEIDHQKYNDFMNLTKEAELICDKARGLNEKAGLGATKLIDEISADLKQWIYHIESIQKFNISLEAQTNYIMTLAESLSENSSLLQSILLDSDADDEILLQAALLAQEIDVFRLGSMRALLVYDTSDIETNYLEVETANETVQRLKRIVRDKKGAAIVDSMAEEIQLYLSAIKQFASDSVESTNVHELNAYDIADRIMTTSVTLSTGVQNVVSEMVKGSSQLSFYVQIATFAVAAIALIIGIIIAARMINSITRPMERMQKLMTRVGETGDMDLSPEEEREITADAKVKDEVGQSVAAFVLMLDRLHTISDALKSVADRNLTVEFKRLSQNDTMGKSVEYLCRRLNRTFHNIRGQANMVANSSEQLSRGAQTLAETTSEQAATIQQLSAAVTEVNNQATMSSTVATKAMENGQTAYSLASEGNNSMKEMDAAVKGICAASENIRQVIKTIDDIAFQTNILALNAAVEAARAGQHGKGFAVVAEEVRNLAAKSAEAAKESEVLLNDTISQSEKGLHIVEKAVGSYNDILEGISTTTKDISEVTSYARSQSEQLDEIAIGVQATADAVQRNSATSEETAAASEEMSATAATLFQLVDQFKLKEITQEQAAQ